MDKIEDQARNDQPQTDAEPDPGSWSARSLIIPAVVGGLIGGGLTVWAISMDRPAGSYAIMSEAIIVVFVGMVLLALAGFIGLMQVLRPTSLRSGIATLTAAGSAVVTAVLVSFIRGAMA